ncbi:glycosyl hydrolase [Lasiosphaeria hispida]|uniref:Glycosyl hydrolase n=1 Tax=Lasiosphaeria hispida TaxID=260671 RepID=A0AAJ0M8J0_9PEZI|nr:glycosyl hydrolase [Lasiosphaeria hispida]
MHLSLPLLGLAAQAGLSLAAPAPTLGNLDFPDPSITWDPQTSAWYAFATQGNGHNTQAAHSPSLHGPWTFLPHIDLLPVPGPWVDAVHPDIWAPDVRYLPATDSFVLYYSGLHAASPYHCIGTATAPNITGPYTAAAEPFACPLADGGAIDASGFVDEAARARYVVYKVDGSSKGAGGPCGNGDPPGLPTPIRLQQVDFRDGVTPVGEATVILDRDPAVDGPLIEAPSLVKANGTYVLFYSSHCYNVPEYDVKYATAKEITGPYKRQPELMGKASDTFELEATGGASSVAGGGTMVLHANCPAGRCMYQTDFAVEDGLVVIADGNTAWTVHHGAA